MLACWIAIGFVLSRYLSDDAVGPLDRAVARLLARHRTRDLNETTEVVSYLAETLTVGAAGVVLFVACRVAWKRWNESLIVLAGLVGEVIIFLGVSTIVDRRRPPVTHLDAAPPTSSFPSGHTAAAVVLYGIVALILARHVHGRVFAALCWIAAAVIATAVGLSRMYRGMHFLTDVIAGALLGSVWLYVCVRTLTPLRGGHGRGPR